MELNNLNFRYFRNAIAGTLSALNDVAQVTQVEKGKIKDYKVPVYYNFAEDSQFMQDFFYQMPNWCNVPEHAEGIFETAPYATLTLDDFNVVQSEITNRYVRANFDKLIVDEKSGEQALMAYSAYLLSLPLELNFSGLIKTDNLLQSFSVMESFLENFYKNTVNYFHYKGLRIPMMVTFGDKGASTRKVPLTYKEKQHKEIPFNIEVETYYPIFDKEEEGSLRFRGNKIRDFYERSRDAITGVQLSQSRTPDIRRYHGNNHLTSDVTFILMNYEGDMTSIFNDSIINNEGKCYTIAVGNHKKEHNVTSVSYDGQNTIIVLEQILNDETIELHLY